jgi:hypothetical protein
MQAAAPLLAPLQPLVSTIQQHQEDTEPLLLSYSSISSYQKCPHSYYMSHVLNVSAPATPLMAYGRGLHDAVATVLGGNALVVNSSSSSSSGTTDESSKRSSRHSRTATSSERHARIDKAHELLQVLYTHYNAYTATISMCACASCSATV